MSQSPALHLPIDEETQLRLHEERYAQEYFALRERNRASLRKWMPWAAYEGSLEETKAYMKQSLLQFAHNEGLQTGIWYQNRLVGSIGYPHLDWADRQVEIPRDAQRDVISAEVSSQIRSIFQLFANKGSEIALPSGNWKTTKDTLKPNY